jgi:hypothetical protein
MMGCSESELSIPSGAATAALVVPQNFADESPKTVVQQKPDCLILIGVGGVPMDQAILYAMPALLSARTERLIIDHQH